MVDLGTGVAAASLFVSLRNLREAQQASERVQTDGGSQTGGPPTSPTEAELRAADTLEKLVADSRRNEPSSGSVDAYVGRTFTLTPGQQVVVRVSPTRGRDLRVRRIEFDRRADHSYKLEVDGVRVSDIHRVEMDPPRVVRNGGTVVAECVNDSSSTTTFDLEVEAWSVPEGE